MKTVLAVACIAAILVVSFISCDWFRSSKEPAFDITGKWVIDSAENKSSDSSKNAHLLALVLASKDSLPVSIQFNKDSTFRYMDAKDSALHHFYVSEDQKSLFVKEDSVFQQMSFIDKSDSAITIASRDSIFLYLKRSK